MYSYTHALEGRRSVELRNLYFEPVRANRAQGFQGPYGGSQLVLTLYRIFLFCFQMCNRLPELMKNVDAGMFPVCYSLNSRCNSRYRQESVEKLRENTPIIVRPLFVIETIANILWILH